METIDQPTTIYHIIGQSAGLAFRIAAIVCLVTLIMIVFNYTPKETLFLSTLGTWIAVFIAEFFRML